jgi:hypothetical protein
LAFVVGHKAGKPTIGFEPITTGLQNQSLAKATHCEQCTYENQEKILACFSAFLKVEHPELAQIFEVWPNLPEHIKKAIMTLALLKK